MSFEFAGKAIYTAVWVAAVSLFMELLGFSTQKWLTAGGLGTVLLTLAGREVCSTFPFAFFTKITVVLLICYIIMQTTSVMTVEILSKCVSAVINSYK